MWWSVLRVWCLFTLFALWTHSIFILFETNILFVYKKNRFFFRISSILHATNIVSIKAHQLEVFVLFCCNALLIVFPFLISYYIVSMRFIFNYVFFSMCLLGCKCVERFTRCVCHWTNVVLRHHSNKYIMCSTVNGRYIASFRHQTAFLCIRFLFRAAVRHCQFVVTLPKIEMIVMKRHSNEPILTVLCDMNANFRFYELFTTANWNL